MSNCGSCRQFFNSSLGSKFIMGVTGLILFGFLVGHLAGNLLIYAGAETFNAYAASLQGNKALLWTVRTVLLCSLAAHVKTAIKLTIANRKARPIPYGFQNTIQASYASRTMIVTGMLVFFYILYHLSHFTLKVVHTEYSQPDNIHAEVIASFQQPHISILYVAAMTLVCMHLYHGIASAVQSLGINNFRIQSSVKKVGATIALVLYVGFISIPISILLGITQ